MPDWTSLRRRAYQLHLGLRDLCGAQAQHPLMPAEALLAAAERETGLTIQPLPAGDPLLAGAQAFLDRDSEMIWYAEGPGIAPERRRFAQAHELAHYWLHPDVVTDQGLPDDEPGTYMAAPMTASAQIEEGYSPQERREREANLFAAELLLPAPVLRVAYLEMGLRAEQIAQRTGLSETCVLTQLAHALLVPAGPPIASPHLAYEAETNRSPLRLDPSQETAARMESGPVLVDAGPGTGKTRTLTARILYLLRECAIPPERILALTFSNRAAEEMTDRLIEAVGETARRVWIGTFHAFGFEILRKDGQRIGLPVRPVLLEPADAITLLENNLDRLSLSHYEYLHNSVLPFPDILDAISRAKDELKRPDDDLRAAQQMAETASTDDERTQAARAAEVAHIYDVYETLLRSSGLVDYGDLIARAVELLENHPDVRERWQRKYSHILADEYQDINRATARLLQLLAGDGAGFWAVGDPRQAIYRFRGASPANIRQFESDFPGGQRLSLEHNYRSRPGIVRVFGALAQGMDAGDGGKAWNVSRDEGGSPVVSLAVADDERAQADWLAEQIRSRQSRGTALRDQAILTATNRRASDIADMLEIRGIAAQHASSLFDRPEVKDLIALLSLATESDGLGLKRVARFPELGMPDEDARAIIDAARNAGRPFPGALQWALVNVALSPQGVRALTRLRDTLLPIAHRGDSWALLSRYLFQTSDYLAPLLGEESVRSQQARLAIYQLLVTVQHMTQRLPLDQLDAPRTAFLARLRRMLQLRQPASVAIPEARNAGDGVRIMTIHQSKGLEFPVVYLPNLVKGQFPARGRGRMASLPDGLAAGGQMQPETEEELFFVALSRARDELILSRTRTWRGRTVEPAPILNRIVGALNLEGASWAGVVSPTGGPALQSIEPCDSETPEPVTGLADGDRPDISLSRLRQYQTCPRQYYYRHVLGLPASGEEAAYRSFDRHLRDTIAWLQTERAAGRTPSAADVQAFLRDRWASTAPEAESALARVLRERANAIVAREQARAAQTAGATTREEFTANLKSGTVRVVADEVDRTDGGPVRVTQHLARKPRKDDHTADHLALLRLAVQQDTPDRPVELSLYSGATGESREIAEDRRWEPKRVEKFEAALRDLTEGRFPPRPSETECPSCPFFFICPE